MDKKIMNITNRLGLDPTRPGELLPSRKSPEKLKKWKVQIKEIRDEAAKIYATGDSDIEVVMRDADRLYEAIKDLIDPGR